MKNLILASVLLVLMAVSCKKDEPVTNQPPVLSDIKLSKNKIGIGQMVVATCNFADSDNDSSQITYSWTDDFGFSQNLKDANWKPTQSGIQNLKVVVSDGINQVVKTKTITVYNCNFRKALWGDSMFDVILNEAPLQGTFGSTTNDFIFNDSPNYLTFQYSFQNDSLIRVTEVYTKTYTDKNDYIVNFDTKALLNNAKYGQPVKQDTIWANGVSESVKNNKLSWGNALNLGYLYIEFQWKDTETLVQMKLFKSTSILFGSVYSKL